MPLTTGQILPRNGVLVSFHYDDRLSFLPITLNALGSLSLVWNTINQTFDPDFLLTYLDKMKQTNKFAVSLVATSIQVYGFLDPGLQVEENM